MKLICELSQFNACLCPTLAVTEMLVNVLNIDSEDDDDEPSVAEGEGRVFVRVDCGVGVRVDCGMGVRVG